MPLGVKKANKRNDYKLESFSLNDGRLYCFTDGFSESRDDKGKEIGIDGVKNLLIKNENNSLQKELKMITNIVKLSSLKKEPINKSSKDSNNLLEDDLTIIGLGK